MSEPPPFPVLGQQASEGPRLRVQCGARCPGTTFPKRSCRQLCGSRVFLKGSRGGGAEGWGGGVICWPEHRSVLGGDLVCCDARPESRSTYAPQCQRGELRPSQSGGSLSWSCAPRPQTLRPTPGPLPFPPALRNRGRGSDSRSWAGEAGGKPMRHRETPPSISGFSSGREFTGRWGGRGHGM